MAATAHGWSIRRAAAPGSERTGQPVPTSSRPAPVRLTRRGRVVLLVLLLVLVGAVAFALAPPGRAAEVPGALPTTVVQSGDTLWSIAERSAPRRDRIATIEEIRRLNHLDGYTIRVGQRLFLPRR